MPTPSNHNRVRSRWGICLNDVCPKSKNKERQEITGRKDFVCSECGRPLKECPPPPKAKWPKYVAAAVIVAAIGGGAIWGISSMGNDSKDTAVTPPVNFPREPEDGAQDSVTQPPVDTATTQTPPPADPVKDEPQGKPDDQNGGKGGGVKTPPQTPPAYPKYGTVRLPYGTYTGDLKNGKPHGHGTIVYSTTHQIISSKSEYVAHKGDKFEGDFRDGMVMGGIGYWYHDGDITHIMP